MVDVILFYFGIWPAICYVSILTDIFSVLASIRVVNPWEIES